jgi:hypothetical protein
MGPLPLPVLFSVIGALLVGAIYFVWSRNSAKK